MMFLDTPSDWSVDVALDVLSIVFWSLIAGGLVIGVIVGLFGRKRGYLRNRVGRPLMDSAAVESAAYGWSPAAQQSAGEHLARNTSDNASGDPETNDRRSGE